MKKHVCLSIWTLGFIISSLHVFVCTADGSNEYTFTDLCYRDDPKVDDCIREKINELAEQYRKGNDKYGLYKFDPLPLNAPLNFEQTTGMIGGQVCVENMVTEGLTTIKMQSFRSKLQNPNKMEFGFTAHFAKMISTGQYQFKGWLGRMSTNADGRFSTTFNNVDISYLLKAKLIEIKNSTYVQIESFHSYAPNFGETKIFATNLIPGNNMLNRMALRFLNQYGTQISNELYPIIGPVLDEIQKSMCNDILTDHPFDVLLPPTRTKRNRQMRHLHNTTTLHTLAN